MDTQGSQDSRGPPTRKKTGKGTAKTATSLGLTKSKFTKFTKKQRAASQPERAVPVLASSHPQQMLLRPPSLRAELSI